jgi:hypothetical protein
LEPLGGDLVSSNLVPQSGRFARRLAEQSKGEQVSPSLCEQDKSIIILYRKISFELTLLKINLVNITYVKNRSPHKLKTIIVN